MKNFWIKNDEFGLPANAIAMYFYLRYMSEKEKYNDFSLADKQLSQALGLHRNTIHKVRNALVEKQLIRVFFKKGMPPVYSMDKVTDDKASNEETTVLKEKRNIKNVSERKKKQSGVVGAIIPSLSEFLDYAKSLEHYEDSLDGLLEQKYNQWKRNGWNNAQGRPITDYKASLKSALPFLKGEPVQNIKLPTIKRP